MNEFSLLVRAEINYVEDLLVLSTGGGEVGARLFSLLLEWALVSFKLTRMRQSKIKCLNQY